MKLREFIESHGFTVDDYDSTVDELLDKGIEKGAFQDYQLLSFVIKIVTDFNLEIHDPRGCELKANVRSSAKKNVLYLNESKRYELNGNEIHCGDVIDISIDGKNFIETSIEHSDSRGYYATINPNIKLIGLYARFTK